MGAAGAPIRVVIAEDHRVVGDGIAAVIADEADMEVAGVVGCGDGLQRAVAAHRPDVAVIAVDGEDPDALAAVNAVHAADGPTRTMALLARASVDTVASARQAGVAGCVPEHVAAEELVEAIRTVAAGGDYLHPDLGRCSQTSPPEPPSLSPREHEVLQQLAAGHSTRQIAAALDLGQETVKTHLSRLYGKLGVADRVQAVVVAFRRGLVR